MRSITITARPWAAVLAACGLLAADAASAAPAKPNVLFLISDDLNTHLGCYGSPHARTPHLDRLAARGVRFERAYCQFPLCGPSRNSMLTGLHPDSTGILGNAQIFRQTIPSHHSLSQAFRLDGYFAARVGKLYHYNVPKSVGTNGHDDPGSWELELNPAGCDRLEEEPHIFSLRPGSFGGTLSWYASPKSDEHHTDAMLARDAEWVLERCARDQDPSNGPGQRRPFFLAVGFYRPHTPYVAPKSYFEPYKLGDMPVVEGWEEDQKDIPAPGLASHKKEHEDLTDPLRREAIQAYFASITFMDAQVGRILAALDRLGLADNTIVVFTSDHGYHLGEHGLWQKMSLFEQSARVPLLIAAPGVARAGGVAASPVSLVDLYPTLTALCGVKAPESLQGQDLVPLLKDPGARGRGYAVTQVRRGRRGGPAFHGYSLRTPRWRYTEWDEGKAGRELYDHDHDPLELTNLAGSPEQADRVASLSEQLKTAVKRGFPKSGQRPALRTGRWAPNLTDP
ncbi:MAG: sulfatase [Akkermansiaceae bacterium]|nr:sulfatase [Akkermansiaceae bacterium]